MALSPLFLIAWSALELAQPLLIPRLLQALSLTLSITTMSSAGLLAKFPTSRTLPALSLTTILPIASWWVALVPQRVFQLRQIVPIIEPVNPLGFDPFFRPFVSDPFFRDVFQLLPRPILYNTPTTIKVMKSQAMPFLEAKVAISVAALVVVGWCWYLKRDEVVALFRGQGTLSNESSNRMLDGALDVPDSDELDEEHKDSMLRAWESRYKLRPAASNDPRDWTVGELYFELEKAGLGGAAEAFKKAGIDGRVALTLTEDDEEEIRYEMNVSKLGDRRRLLLFLNDLRAASASASSHAATDSKPDEGGGGGA
mmetsp:Transcript_30609/g.59808  ORF Transcript_30609/g.59808 Transcript_30609/m.59808 type:complete len:312 (-) Transcript_30609:17-952(-)